MCPKCEKPLYGSASRGKMGTYYPAYHCNKRGHYFRVSKKNLNDTVYDFIRSLHVTPEYADKLMKAVLSEWEKRQKATYQDKTIIENKIKELESSARLIADKIRMLSSETAIRYMEEDLEKIEKQMAELMEQETQKAQETINMEEVMGTVKYFLEHLEELLIYGANPEKKAALFSLIFQMAPTYDELVSGTPQLAPFVALKDDYDASYYQMVTPWGFEPQITWMKTKCPRPLDDGAKQQLLL